MLNLNMFYFFNFLNTCFLFINKKIFFVYKFSLINRSLISADIFNLIFINKILSRGGLLKPLMWRLNS